MLYDGVGGVAVGDRVSDAVGLRERESVGDVLKLRLRAGDLEQERVDEMV